MCRKFVSFLKALHLILSQHYTAHHLISCNRKPIGLEVVVSLWGYVSKFS